MGTAMRGCLSLMVCLVAALPWCRAHAESAPAATWRPIQISGPFIGADATGFWNHGGEHIRPDGKRDLALKVPDGLHGEVDTVASGPDGPVIWARGDGDALLVAYDKGGSERWSLKLGDDRGQVGAMPQMKHVGLAVDPNGDVILAGKFSGCVRFGGGKGKRTCINEKAARRFDNGICDPCTQAFVAVYDARGKLRSVFAPPGYPADFFAAAADGRIALAGGWDASLDLDPDAGHEAIVKQPGNPKPGAGDHQGFWSIFDRRGEMRWLGGQGVVGRGEIYPDGVAFGADGSLVAVLSVRPDAKGNCTLTDGTTATKVPVETPHTVVVAFEKPGAEPAAVRRTADRLRVTGTQPDTRVLASPTGGVFVLGALEAPAQTMIVEATQPHRDELTIVGVQGPGKGMGIRMPAGVFQPEAVLAHEGRICFVFEIRGAHKLASGGGTISIGDPQGSSAAIGCFRP